MEVAEEDQPKRRSPHRKAFFSSQFGLCSVPSTFQRWMNRDFLHGVLKLSGIFGLHHCSGTSFMDN